MAEFEDEEIPFAEGNDEELHSESIKFFLCAGESKRITRSRPDYSRSEYTVALQLGLFYRMHIKEGESVIFVAESGKFAADRTAVVVYTVDSENFVMSIIEGDMFQLIVPANREISIFPNQKPYAARSSTWMKTKNVDIAPSEVIKLNILHGEQYVIRCLMGNGSNPNDPQAWSCLYPGEVSISFMGEEESLLQVTETNCRKFSLMSDHTYSMYLTPDEQLMLSASIETPFHFYIANTDTQYDTILHITHMDNLILKGDTSSEFEGRVIVEHYDDNSVNSRECFIKENQEIMAIAYNRNTTLVIRREEEKDKRPGELLNVPLVVHPGKLRSIYCPLGLLYEVTFDNLQDQNTFQRRRMINPGLIFITTLE